MSKVKLMIADGEQGMSKNTLEYFCNLTDIEVVGSTGDGEQALAMACDCVPDVMLLSLIMTQIDGLEVLKRMEAMDMKDKPKVIIYSTMCQDSYITSAMNLGAYYFVTRPFDLDVLHERIVEIADVPPEELRAVEGQHAQAEMATAHQTPRSDEDRISELLLCLGVPAGNSGYGYLRTGIQMVKEDPMWLQGKTKALYPAIAQRHNTNWKNVERAMRFGIKNAWDRGRVEEANQLLGQKIFCERDRPSCGEFIALVADRMRVVR